MKTGRYRVSGWLTKVLLTCLLGSAGAAPPSERPPQGPQPTWTPFVFPATAAVVADATERHRQRIINYRTTYRLDEALSELHRYMKNYPGDAWAALEHSECLLLREEFAEAEREVRRAMQLGAEPVEATLRLAQVLAGWGKPQR